MAAPQEPGQLPGPPQGPVVGSSSLPRRRVALRAAVGILLLSGMILGWTAMGRQKARKQAEAIQAVEAVGGHVYLDYQWQDGQAQVDGKPQQATWLRRLVGPESLDRAVAVDLRSIEQPGEIARSLLLLPHLEELNASGTPFDDAALETACRLIRLRRLDLSQTVISDKGVARLSRLGGLVYLSLASTDVSDQCVKALAKLKHLRQLDLTATQVSEDAAAQLGKSLPKCKIVN
jgi:hypothetical protein